MTLRKEDLLENMSDREFAIALMRGDRASLQKGYSPEAAALSVTSLRDLSESEHNDVLAFCTGWLIGTTENQDRINTVEVNQ